MRNEMGFPVAALCSAHRKRGRLVWLLLGLAVVAFSAAAMAQEFSDAFDTTRLDPRWSWVREDSSNWSLSAHPGFLRIITQRGGLLGPTNNARNVLLTAAPAGDFLIETYVEFRPTEDFQIAGLIVYENDDSFLMLGRAHCSAPAPDCVGNGIYFDEEYLGDPVAPNYATPTASRAHAHLRIERRGAVYTAAYSDDGTSWMTIGVKEWYGNPRMVGVAAEDSDQGAAPTPADFGGFTLRSLPAGAADLRFACWNTGTRFDTDLAEAVPVFELERGIDVVLEVARRLPDYKAQIAAQVAAGSLPDALLLTADMLPALRDVLVPLGEALDVYPALLSGLGRAQAGGIVSRAMDAAGQGAADDGDGLLVVPFGPLFGWQSNDVFLGFTNLELIDELVKLGSILCMSSGGSNPQLGSVWFTSGSTLTDSWICNLRNACLPNWSCSLVHTLSGGCSFAPSFGEYYRDATISSGGKDTDPTRGVDVPMLHFHSSHSSPVSDPPCWSTGSTSGYCGTSSSEMLLGNSPGTGRYFILVACETFAHGSLCKTPGLAQCPPSELFRHAHPENYEGSATLSKYAWPTEANIYGRWGPVLGPDVRMLCGISTQARPPLPGEFWSGLKNSTSTADGILDGLQLYKSTQKGYQVPICLTSGTADINSTPLVLDSGGSHNGFTNLPHPVTNPTHYHIQYRTGLTGPPGSASVPDGPTLGPYDEEEVPEAAPVLYASPMGLPAELEVYELVEQDGALVSIKQVPDQGPRVTIEPGSGAVHITGEWQPVVTTSLITDDFLQFGVGHLGAAGLLDPGAVGPFAFTYEIATIPIADEMPGLQEEFRKNVTIYFTREVELEAIVGGGLEVTTIPVVGPGGYIAVRMHNDGSLALASKVWRMVVPGDELLPLKTPIEAFEEARDLLDDPSRYELADWEWGYYEEGGGVAQREMRIVYSFFFLPLDLEDPEGYPRELEVPGFRDE